MRRSVRPVRNSYWRGCLSALAVFAFLPAAQAQFAMQIGPRVLYPQTKAFTNHGSFPLAMRDAIQHIANGSRLLAVKPRIIGGEPAPVGIYPWAASIGLKGVAPRDGHFCGGSFIAADWVLTAAHCLKPVQAGTIQVYGGSNELERAGTVFPVDRIIVHEQYDDGTQENDVALIHLTRRFSGETLRLITPANSGEFSAVGTLAVAVGWGLTAEGSEVQNVLRRVTVQVVDNRTCNGLAAYAGAITDGMLCAGFPEGGKDSCQGDSGGPLAVGDGTGRRFQIGIVSWGEGCGRPNKFGVYTRVANYQAWIADRLAGKPQPARVERPTALTAPAPAMQTQTQGPPAPAQHSIAPSVQTNPAAPRRNGVASNSRAEVVTGKKSVKAVKKEKKPARRVVQ